jgi:hypothetical protein
LWLRRLFVTNDRDVLFSALYMIRPARMPTARHWHRLIESELEHSPWRQDRRVQAVLTAFWEHWAWCSASWRSLERNGRSLGDWFCGEELRAGIHEHMAPWWDGRASNR